MWEVQSNEMFETESEKSQMERDSDTVPLDELLGFHTYSVQPDTKVYWNMSYRPAVFMSAIRVTALSPPGYC